MSGLVGSVKNTRGHTYEKKKPELIQSNKFPVGSPPKMSSGKPCSLALPKSDLSRTIDMLMDGLGENDGNKHANR